jgi:hypothetical protein
MTKGSKLTRELMKGALPPKPNTDQTINQSINGGQSSPPLLFPDNPIINSHSIFHLLDSVELVRVHISFIDGGRVLLKRVDRGPGDKIRFQ